MMLATIATTIKRTHPKTVPSTEGVASPRCVTPAAPLWLPHLLAVSDTAPQDRPRVRVTSPVEGQQLTQQGSKDGALAGANLCTVRLTPFAPPNAGNITR